VIDIERTPFPLVPLRETKNERCFISVVGQRGRPR